MSFSAPPIVKLAERLLLEIEQAVRRWAQYHKYALGTDLRAKAFEVCTLVHRAWRDRGRIAEWLAQLVWAIDDLKLRLQLGSRLRAFSSFAQFEALARQASELGRQAGGWHRQHQHSKVQNAGDEDARQRDQILSTRTAPKYGVRS